MSAFRPISPRAALQLLEDADIGVDCARLLADLAEAGVVKGYARLVETTKPGVAKGEVRDARIDRAVWKRIVADGKVDEVFGVGSVRLGTDAVESASVLGIRFDENSVRGAAADYGRNRQPLVSQVKPVPAPCAQAPVPPSDASPVEPPAADAAFAIAKPFRKVLAADAVAVSVNDAAEVLGMSRGTIYKLMDQGQLASKKVGGRRLVSADSVRGFVA